MGFIVAAVAAVVKVVVAAVKIIAPIIKFLLPVIAAVVAFVATPFIGGLTTAAPDIPTGVDESQRQQGVLVQRTGSNTNIPVVYGYRKVGGAVTFAETGSDNNQYLWVAYVLSEGPIEGLREAFIDDYQLPANIIEQLNAGQIVDVAEGKYSGRVRLQFYHGVYYDNPRNSSVGSNSICKESPSWKSSMVYNGLAVMFARYTWKKIETQEDADNNPFGGSIPEFQASILGRKVADITLATAANYDYASAPTRYSTNPVDHLVDYLRNPRYGKGLKNSDFNWTYFRKAALKCNQRVEYVNGTFGPILTNNMVLDTGAKIINNTKTLLAGMRGYMPDVQGKYKLKIEDAGNDDDILSGVATIANTFDEDNIVGTITYTGIERTSKYNSVKVGFVDPDKKWSNAEVVYPESPAERQIYINEDGGRINQGDVFFPGITNYAIAKDMARMIFNKSRFQESCSLTVSSEGIELEPGDNIYIQSKMLNFSTIPWRIVSMSINANMTVDIGCVRNKDDIYPHTRVGEEDIVLPTYVPRGATIYYPAVQTTVPVGLIPPTKARLPRVYEPPFITAVQPTTLSSAGVNQISVYGNNFYNGATAVFIDKDGNEVVPNDVNWNSRGRLDIETTVFVNASGQPYSIKITNPVAFGGLSCTAPNVLNMDNTQPPWVIDPINNPVIVDPPVEENPWLKAPPEVRLVSPVKFASPGVNQITIDGRFFKPGIAAVFIGADGTEYAPNDTNLVNEFRLDIETVPAMTAANQPYSIRITNTETYGGHSVLIQNTLNLDNTDPPGITDPVDNPIIVPPGVIPPETPNPSDPPPTGETPNDPPPEAPEEQPLNDIFEITNITFQREDNYVSAVLTGIVPENPFYNQVAMYYRRAGTQEPYYQKYEFMTQTPGAEATVILEKLIPGQKYELISRVKYDTGESSISTNRIQFTAKFTGSEDPVDFVQESETAWPPAPGQPSARRDNPITIVSGAPILSGGLPKAVRELSITLKQDISVNEPNFDITGIEIYGKPSNFAYWQKLTTTNVIGPYDPLPNSYVPGDEITITLEYNSTYPEKSLGDRVYPAIPTDAEQNWDFIFRWRYTTIQIDSYSQTRAVNVPIEYKAGSYNFDPFAGATIIQEKVKDYAMEEGAPTDNPLMVMNDLRVSHIGETTERGSRETVIYVEGPGGFDQLREQYVRSPEVAAAFRGVEIQIRSFNAGNNVSPTVYLDTNRRVFDEVQAAAGNYQSSHLGKYKFFVDLPKDEIFEIVITPRWLIGSTVQRGQRSVYGYGKILSNLASSQYPNGSALMDYTFSESRRFRSFADFFNFQNLFTDDALIEVGTTGYTGPERTTAALVNLYDWRLTSKDNPNYQLGWTPETWYYPDYDGVVIYRRNNNPDKNLTEFERNRYGYGRWERFVVDDFAQTGKLVRLRPPETYQYYNPNYNGSGDLTRGEYANVCAYGGDDDFIVVARIAGVESTSGWLLPKNTSQFYFGMPGKTGQILYLNVARPRIVKLSDYNNEDPALGKNLNQARTAPANALMRDYLKRPITGFGDTIL